jgi:hypothetical protein
VGVALGWLVDAVVARAVGPLVGAAADVDADGWAPAGIVGVGVGVGPAVHGAVGVDGTVGIAVGDAVADGVGAESRRTGDGTGRGRVVAPAGPTGAIG